MFVRSFSLAACCALLAGASFAQTSGQENNQLGGTVQTAHPAASPIASPSETAQVSLNGKEVTIHYNSPRMHGRKIMGEVVPYGKVWRTGANPATTLITSTNLKIGTLEVPAGTYTLYTLPSAAQWLLIVNKQNGQWGTIYNESQDLGRTPMTGRTLPSPQENMSISFEHTHGAVTELHVRWEKADEYVPVTAE